LLEVEILSWPSLQQFNESFTRDKGFSNESVIATKNANPQSNPNRRGAMTSADNFQMTGMKYSNRYSYIYENAHIPVTDVLNPNNWNKLIDRWKSGQH